MERSVPPTTLAAVPISTADGLLSFYRGLLPDLCTPGSDPSSFGETAYVDADLLSLLNERVNVHAARRRSEHQFVLIHAGGRNEHDAAPLE